MIEDFEKACKMVRESLDRANPEIFWKDKVALEAMKALVITGVRLNLGIMSEAKYESLAKEAYRIADAMWLERSKDEHNPKKEEVAKEQSSEEIYPFDLSA